jgi:CMP-N-acetylneuraminic acid synthetase
MVSTDKASSVDSVIHALDWYENSYGKVDGLLLLQPTSPFRRKKSKIKGIKLFSEKKL